MMVEIALVAAAAFNLACSGTMKSTSFDGSTTKSYDYLYRVDLDARKWCSGDCSIIKDIADVQPGVLVLQPKEDIDTPTRKQFFLGSIDRQTGRHSMLSTSGRGAEILMLEWDGQCEKQPFSGFPKIDTKF